MVSAVQPGFMVAEADSAAAVGQCRLVVMPHWRREVGDVVRTLEEAGLRTALMPFRRRTAVMLSDRHGPRPLRHMPMPTGRARRLRLWWNGADDISSYVAAASRQAANETHITFFQEVVEELRLSGLDLVLTPYAFARPAVEPAQALDGRIGFTGEVDISDDGLVGACPPQQTAAGLPDHAWDLAGEIVAGRRSLVATELLIRAESGPPAVHRALLWAVKNRVRYLLVRAIAAEFPGRLVLRGADWSRLGFDARPTDFHPAARMADYRTYRVSLDLGSKSTHAGLYPRTAEILAAGGGLVQFWSGADSDDLRSTLAPRQAGSVDGLLTLIDQQLSRMPETLLAANREMYVQYRAFRLDVGARLAAEIVKRCP